MYKRQVVCPLCSGVISDYLLVEQLVGTFMKKVSSSKLFMSRVVACIPGEVTEVEKKAVVNAISTTGVRKICLIEEPVAAAIGDVYKRQDWWNSFGWRPSNSFGRKGRVIS